MRPDWLITRVVVVLLAIMGPLYFFLLMIFMPFRMAPFSDPLHNWLFHFLAVPAVFSAPWLGVIYYERYRLANTVQLMQESTTTVPLRWRVFYGANAGFVLALCILPLATPPMAILAGLVVAGHVFSRIARGKFGGGKPAVIAAVIVAIALCVLPILVLIEFVPNYFIVWQAVLDAWVGFWFDVVYGVAQCLVNALSFGAPIYFLFFAAQQYDKGIYGEIYTESPTLWIRISEAVLFFIFIFLYLPPIPTTLGVIPFQGPSSMWTEIINTASLVIVVMMIIIRKILKVRNDTTMGGLSNILIVGLFLIVELFFRTQLLVATLIIWAAFLVYAGLISISFLRASPTEMY